MFEQLLKTVAEFYGGDPTTAGVVAACIGPGKFYASVVRYHERFGQGKHVVATSTGETLDATIETLLDTWLQLVRAEIPAQQECLSQFTIKAR